MATATINVETPSGFLVQLVLTPDDESKRVVEFVERVEKFTTFLAGRSWQPVEPNAPMHEAAPSAGELAGGPSFCGYPCSPTVDERGLPSWIIADGRQAHRHDKQGDSWYSYRDGEMYVQVLRIPKGERAPAVVGVPWPGGAV